MLLLLLLLLLLLYYYCACVDGNDLLLVICFITYRFYRAMHFSAKRGIAIVCYPSICPSVRL